MILSRRKLKALKLCFVSPTLEQLLLFTYLIVYALIIQMSTFEFSSSIDNYNIRQNLLKYYDNPRVGNIKLRKKTLTATSTSLSTRGCGPSIRRIPTFRLATCAWRNTESTLNVLGTSKPILATTLNATKSFFQLNAINYFSQEIQRHSVMNLKIKVKKHKKHVQLRRAWSITLQRLIFFHLRVNLDGIPLMDTQLIFHQAMNKISSRLQN